MGNGATSSTEEPASAQTRCETNPPHRVLVVEDDVDIRHLSVRMLLRSGYRVDAAADGIAGWEALDANNYDLLITDNDMPKMSGLELVKKLRSARIALPVVLASGGVGTEDLPRDLRSELAATLRKPFTVDELLETVKKVLCAEPSRCWHAPNPGGRSPDPG